MGLCKLAPLWPEIHIFSRTHWLSIRQVIQKKIPKGSFDFCTFQTQLYFISARMMWRIAKRSGGELRAWRGNGAENSSQSKGRCCSWARKWGREAAPTLVTLLNGVQSPCPWGGRGGQPADTWPFTPTNPSLIPPSTAVLLITKQ